MGRAGFAEDLSWRGETCVQTSCDNLMFNFSDSPSALKDDCLAHMVFNHVIDERQIFTLRCRVLAIESSKARFIERINLRTKEEPGSAMMTISDGSYVMKVLVPQQVRNKFESFLNLYDEVDVVFLVKYSIKNLRIIDFPIS